MNAPLNLGAEASATPIADEVDQLADVIAVSSARIDAATHELLTQIRRFDQLGGWAWQGAKSCVAWLSWRIGLSVGAAGEKVRVARALGELPLIDAAFAAGELSYCKVRAMTRVATAETEELLLTMARSATGAQLERICRGFRRVQRQAAADDDERRLVAGADRFVRRRHTADGMVRIEMQLLPDEAELVWQALEQVRGELVTEVKGREEAAEAAERGAAGPTAERATDLSAESVEGAGDDAVAGVAAEPTSWQPDDLPAESVVGPDDPLAHLFAHEPPEPRGYWDRCEETGELVYYGSDPPDVWPEETDLSAERSAVAAVPMRSDVPSLVDAVVLLAERQLSHPQASTAVRRGGERSLLLVHLSEDRLAAAAGSVAGAADPGGKVPFCAELHDGGVLAGEALLRLACDCGITVVKTDQAGAPLDVGRRRRTISPALMRALLVRDGGCQFPGCCGKAWIEAHHIEHWAHGGATKLDNVTLLCRFHHGAVHEGGFRIERGADGALRVFDPAGRQLEAAPEREAALGEAGAVAAIALEQTERGVVIDHKTSLPAWDGTAPDYGAAVAGLWRRQVRGEGADRSYVGGGGRVRPPAPPTSRDPRGRWRLRR